MSLLFSFVAASVVTMGAQAPSTPAKPPQGTSQPKPAPHGSRANGSCASRSRRPCASTTPARARSDGPCGNGDHRHGSQGGNVAGYPRRRHGYLDAQRRDGRERKSEFPWADGRNVSTQVRRRQGDFVRARGHAARRASPRRRCLAESSAGAAATAPHAAARAGSRARARQSGRRANRRASTSPCCSKRSSSASRHAASHCFPAAATSGRR